MTRGFPGVLRHQGLQLRPRSLMVQGCLPGRLKQAGKLGPGVGSAHVDGADRLDPRPWRLDAKQARGLAGLDAAPELLLGGQQQVLVERIGRNRHLDPFAAAGNDRQHRGAGGGDPHIVLQLGHVFLGRTFLRERPWQHELGLEDGTGCLDHPVEGSRHPPLHRMQHLALHLGDHLASVALIPVPVEALGHGAELDDQIVREVLGLDLTALFAPKPEQGGLIVRHDNPGVRTADEGATIRGRSARMQHLAVSIKKIVDPWRRIVDRRPPHTQAASGPSGPEPIQRATAEDEVDRRSTVRCRRRPVTALKGQRLFRST